MVDLLYVKESWRMFFWCEVDKPVSCPVANSTKVYVDIICSHLWSFNNYVQTSVVCKKSDCATNVFDYVIYVYEKE